MGSAVRSLALGLMLVSLSSSSRAHTADPRLRAHNSVKTRGLELSCTCSLRVTLTSQPTGIRADSPDCGGAGCKELPTVGFRSKDATAGVSLGSIYHETRIGDSSGWREVFDFDCLDNPQTILYVSVTFGEGHSLVCELGPVEDVSSGQEEVCSGLDGTQFYYSVEHHRTLPDPEGTKRMWREVVPRALQANTSEPTATPTPEPAPVLTPEPTVEETSPAETPEPTTAQPVPSPTPEPVATVLPTPSPTQESTSEPVASPTLSPTLAVATMDPTAAPITPTLEPTTPEPTTAEPATPEPTTAEPATPEPTTAESTTPEPTTAEPATPEPTTAEPTTPEPTTAEPTTPEPTTAPPVTPEPIAAEPTTSEPTLAPTPDDTLAPVGTPETPSPVATPTNTPSSTLELTPEPIPSPTPAPTVSAPNPTTLEPTSPPSGTIAPLISPTTFNPFDVTTPVTDTPVAPTKTPTVVTVPDPTVPSTFFTTLPVSPPTVVPSTLRPTTNPVGASIAVTEAPVERASPTPAPSDEFRTEPFATPVGTPIATSTPEPSSRITPIEVVTTVGPTPVPAPAPFMRSPSPPPHLSPYTSIDNETSPTYAQTYSPTTTTTNASVSPLIALSTPPPPPPSPSPSASPTAAPTGTKSPAPSALSAPVTEGKTDAPQTSPTSVPSTDAPAESPTPSPTVLTGFPATTETPVPSENPTPTPAPTPSPSLNQCTEECLELESGNIWTSHFLDPDCGGDDPPDGCNLSDDSKNCRRCLINPSMFDDGDNEAEWEECPCCVVEYANLPTDIEGCNDTNSTAITLSDTDVDVMILTFDDDDANCKASGIIIYEDGSTVMNISDYSDTIGDCNSDFDIVYGTIECDADDTTEYTWDFNSDEYTYSYSCEGTSESNRIRRRLQESGGNSVSVSSNTVLCNDGEFYFSLAESGDEYAAMYADEDADGFANVTADETSASGIVYCNGVSEVMSNVLVNDPDTLIDDPDEDSDTEDEIPFAIIIPAVVAFVLFMVCACFCFYRNRKGGEGRVDQMRRNLGYTPDMDGKGEGNFGPTNKHVAITRGGGPHVTPDMLATKGYQPNYPVHHHRAPSEAPSSIIEDNIANNYRPKKAAQNWEKRKEHKLTKPAPQQHVIGAGPTSEELKVEDAKPAQSAGSEQLSEHSLSRHEITTRNQSGSNPTSSQAQYGYTFNEMEMEQEDDDDDARSAVTGMSGPSKYAPSGYAPSSQHGGVTHDLMSQYEPSVYEADSQYDPSLYGRESEYEESSAYSYNPSSRSGGYGHVHHGARGRQMHHGPSARGSIADTAAMSHLGSVVEMDDGGETNSAYAPSDSYVSSYVSSEDDDGRIGRGVHSRGQHHQLGEHSPPGGYSSRHHARRSGREIVSAGRSGFGGSSGEVSSRHSGGRSGFEMDSRDYDEDSDMHHTSMSVDDMEYQDSGITTSSQGAPLTDVGDRHGRRW